MMFRALLTAVTKDTTLATQHISRLRVGKLHINAHIAIRTAASLAVTAPPPTNKKYNAETFQRRKKLLEKKPSLDERDKLNQEEIQRLVEKLTEHQQSRKSFSAY